MIGKFLLMAGMLPCLIFAQPSKGKPVEPQPEDAARLTALKGKLKGKIIWSTSRVQNHDIWIMNADGTEPKPLTNTPKTDWYARFSPDGQQIIFTRSKLDWTIETDANYPERWDTWIINTDGTGEKMLIPKATWATWSTDGKEIVFSRGEDVMACNADGSNERTLVNGNKELMGGLAQHPKLSDDGLYLGVTLRGKKRETGILNMKTRKWFTSGGGCQFSFFPNSHRCIRVNQTGKGGTQIFAFDLKDDGTHGKISGNKVDGKDIRLIDLPGRITHEYFPKLSADGKYLIWGATQRGHDHDLADYELFLWKIGDPWEAAVRLTFHSGNDRWPDIHFEK